MTTELKVSKTKINERMKKKTNPILSEAIWIAKKINPELAGALSVSTRKHSAVNLDKLNAAKTDTIIVIGKVLGMGEMNKKAKIYALGYSESAREKLKKAGCEVKTIYEALKKGDKLKGEIIN